MYSKAPPTASAVLDVLRRRIVGGGIRAGSRLVERHLCQEFNVSRTAVRESLIRLADCGLVDLIPDAGATVQQITGEQIIDAYVYREAIESAAARQCADRMSRQQSQELCEIAKEFKAQYDVCCLGKPHRLLELEVAFHGRIVGGSGNRFLQRGWEIARMHLCRGILGNPDELAGRESRRAIVDDHAAIARAIRDGKADKAGELMRQHIGRGRSLLLERLRRRETEQLLNP